jgi:hypothetical protein
MIYKVGGKGSSADVKQRKQRRRGDTPPYQRKKQK